MALTQITVENHSHFPIKFKLIWGLSEIGSVDIEPAPRVKAPPPSGNIPCEYVWYDLIISDKSGTSRILEKSGVYGGTSWVWTGEDLYERPQATPPIIEQETHHPSR
jgi:hypothetical protein